MWSHHLSTGNPQIIHIYVCFLTQATQVSLDEILRPSSGIRIQGRLVGLFMGAVESRKLCGGLGVDGVDFGCEGCAVSGHKHQLVLQNRTMFLE